jgi:predicted aspartyl protease
MITRTLAAASMAGAILAGCAAQRLQPTQQMAASDACPTFQQDESILTCMDNAYTNYDNMAACAVPFTTHQFWQCHSQLSRTALERADAPREIELERHGDSYLVPASINHSAPVLFLLDTGADSLVIPLDMYTKLVSQGALGSGDQLVGKSISGLAGGSTTTGYEITIREVNIGGHILTDVAATIFPGGLPLLGQSVLSRFGNLTIDRRRDVLILAP